jgi:hypothetical protein
MTLILTVVLVLGGLTLYRAGRMTADKMELQNAADAMAFGVSTVEARDLNFTAYTNRAIIANEVAIGQAIGMASWAYHWKSLGDFLLEYNKFLSGPTLGISNSILPPLATPFQVSGGVFVTMMRAYAKAMTAVNHNVNKVYGIAQQIYHLASIINTLGMLDAAIKDNAPEQAHMSGYGVLMLLSHLATYGGLPTSGIIDHLPSMVADQLKPFTKSYDPSAAGIPTADWQADTAGDTDAGGFGRLAAIIHNSGDPFTKGHVNPPDSDNPNLTGRGWIINFFDLLQQAGLMPAPVTISFDAGIVKGGASFGVFTDPDPPRAKGPGWLGFSMNGGVDFGIVGASLEYHIYIRMRMLREGGSELRMVVPLTGSNANQAAGNEFSWSSADTTNFDLGFAGGGSFDAFIRLPFIGKVNLISASIDMVVADDNMFLGFSFGGSGTGCSDPTTDDDPDNDDDEPVCEDASGDADVVLYDGAFPTSAPMGAAFVHSGKTTGAGAQCPDLDAATHGHRREFRRRGAGADPDGSLWRRRQSPHRLVLPAQPAGLGHLLPTLGAARSQCHAVVQGTATLHRHHRVRALVQVRRPVPAGGPDPGRGRFHRFAVPAQSRQGADRPLRPRGKFRRRLDVGGVEVGGLFQTPARSRLLCARRRLCRTRQRLQSLLAGAPDGDQPCRSCDRAVAAARRAGAGHFAGRQRRRPVELVAGCVGFLT